MTALYGSGWEMPHGDRYAILKVRQSGDLGLEAGERNVPRVPDHVVWPMDPGGSGAPTTKSNDVDASLVGTVSSRPWRQWLGGARKHFGVMPIHVRRYSFGWIVGGHARPLENRPWGPRRGN